MSRNADPRGSWAFRRRVALARAAGALEFGWSAAWPSLMVVGAFLVSACSASGVLPAWLHALGLLAFLAALLWTAWRGARMPGAGRITAPGCAVSSRSTGCRTSRCGSLGDRLSGGAQDRATQALWRRHLERLRQAVRGLRSARPAPICRGATLGAAHGHGLLLWSVWWRPAAWRRGAWCKRSRSVAATGPRRYRSRPPCGSRRRPIPGGRRCGWRPAPPPTERRGGAGAPTGRVPAGSEVLAQLHHFRAAADRFALASTGAAAFTAHRGGQRRGDLTSSARAS